MFDRREAEGTKRRHQVDTVVEGMYVVNLSLSRSHAHYLGHSGINRVVENFQLAIIDDVFR